MKKFLKVFIFFYIFALLFSYSSQVAYAHPGRTDSDGYHVCKTNCEKWGLGYGEYHCHDTPKVKEKISSSTDKKAEGNYSAAALNVPEKENKRNIMHPLFLIAGLFVTYNIIVLVKYSKKK